ncbi:DUF1684 domain-containing protein [Marinithermus hydrothermalis]|uniref:DUF1684 domain-containing protein n=1 Tax=Marinithermus hydrothermalis (strain DSM 14884 / JCM 11576 / T1) TaxID=869210 RepID=F2NL33_MARHT|nr:DUF1684 domain-containing protein [Marinithermus hydrothermalis]AEB11436.1 protein of unknown function DUF1684 [Marinithermus hydrothermalis DSM 14884]
MDELQLLDWRRRVHALYAEVRAVRDPHAAWVRWRAERDRLFKTHPQSPLTPEQRAAFTGLEYFPYDPAWRVEGMVEPDPAPEAFTLALREDGTFRMRRFARVRFRLGGASWTLALFWIEGYGGGLFLPFRDATNGDETYGGGRYLLDTIKGADLGGDEGRIVLDFNFAYNPSCAYHPRWHCPLAPEENRLALPVRAGERAFTG